MTAKANAGSAVPTVLGVCPSHRDRRELGVLANAKQCHLLFHDYASIELEEMVAPSPKRTAATPVHEEVERIVAEAARAGVRQLSAPMTTLAARWPPLWRIGLGCRARPW